MSSSAGKPDGVEREVDAGGKLVLALERDLERRQRTAEVEVCAAAGFRDPRDDAVRPGPHLADHGRALRRLQREAAQVVAERARHDLLADECEHVLPAHRAPLDAQRAGDRAHGRYANFGN
jgi:hypothetical protein